MSIVIDLNLACVVCLEENGGELKYIYSPPEMTLGSHLDANLEIADMIAQCTQLLVHNIKAKLPDKICERCMEDLLAAWRFRQNCETANSVYRTIQQQDEDAEKLANYELERHNIKLPSAIKIRRIHPKTYFLPIDKDKTALDTTTPIKNENLFEVEILSDKNLESAVQENFILTDAEEEEEETEVLSDQQLNINDCIEEVICKDEDMQELQDITPKTEKSKLQEYNIEIVSPEETSEQSEVDTKSLIKHAATSKQLTASKRQRDGRHIKNKTVEHKMTITRINQNIKIKDENLRSKNAEYNKVQPKTKPPTSRKKGVRQAMKICEVCGNVYKYQHALTAHMRRHTNDRQFNCEFCEKAFVSNVELRRHMRVHTGQKPYACAYCDRRFSDFGSRIKHERTHTGERPYRCGACGKAFAYAHVLTVHLRTHTGEKKFRCTQCGKGFTKKSYLIAHQEQHERFVNIRSSLLNDGSRAINIKAEIELQQHQEEMTAIKTVAMEECIFTTEFIKQDETMLPEDEGETMENDSSLHFIEDLQEVEETLNEEHLEDGSELVLGMD